jgi:hypothetical protein
MPWQSKKNEAAPFGEAASLFWRLGSFGGTQNDFDHMTMMLLPVEPFLRIMVS